MPPPDAVQRRRWRWLQLLRSSLSARLLVLTVLFVMLAEVLIYAPSIANFRRAFLEDRVAAARLAAFTLEAVQEPGSDSGQRPPDPGAEPQERGLSRELTTELLGNVGARVVVLNRSDRRLLLGTGPPPEVDLEVDLRRVAPLARVAEALAVLVRRDNRVLHVTGEAPGEDGVLVEAFMDEAPLRAAMLSYSGNILLLSFVISAISATLVYVSLHLLVVRPLRRMTAAVQAIAARPTGPDNGVPPGDRPDEVGVAERAVADMQAKIRDAHALLGRLTWLGTDRAKIVHDLRGALSPVVIQAAEFGRLPPEKAVGLVPEFARNADLAVGLCEKILVFLESGRGKPKRTEFALRDLVEELDRQIRAGAGAGGDGRRVGVLNDVAPDLRIFADRTQLYLVLDNLARNAFQAGARQVRVAARVDVGTGNAGAVVVDVSDDGPGLPADAIRDMFEAFKGSLRPSGTGLGLASAKSVMDAHGGDIVLVSSDDAAGATFRLTLPKGG